MPHPKIVEKLGEIVLQYMREESKVNAGKDERMFKSPNTISESSEVVVT